MKNRISFVIILGFLLSILLLPSLKVFAQGPVPGQTPFYRYQVVRSYPHDRQAFTQGLIFKDGALYEGTGLQGQSFLRRMDLKSGHVEKEVHLDSAYFGEGITAFADRIVQLTWQSHIGFVYDRKSFRLLSTFSYPSEGWGVTHNGKSIIMSDGTDVLHLLDIKSFRKTGSIRVHDERGFVTGLNELEYVKGEIYANIWPTDLIAIIDPRTGRVKARLNMENLLSKQDAIGTDVLNGIAYDARGDRLFVTGKLWPKIFEIKLIKK
ncbi:MAG: glutaminyl-peptide cyclotransferase [Syntrophales bacterium]|nr:glutaminyl-peptide cyclotransferase [Syntrophales bacterium]